MKQEINLEWAKKFNNMSSNTPSAESKKNIEWIGNKDFKKLVKFKMLPPNSKENGKFGFISAMHFNLGPNHDQHFICPEKTFPEKGVICPVCQLKRDLINKYGFKEEDLTIPGKFGPMPLFDPSVTSSIKVVITDTDQKHDWDKSHISVLQMRGDYLITWLVNQYMSPETEDFLDYNLGAVIKFSREIENGKWDRTILATTVENNRWNAPMEIINKVKEENEELTLSDLYKFPTDDQFLNIKNICNDTLQNFLKVREEQTQTAASFVNETTSPTCPF